MKEIVLTNSDKKLVVDDEDFDKVARFKWRLYGNYGCSSEGFSTHRFIMDFPQGKIVDHINKNPLDNRRENLRVCSKAENNRNTKKVKKTSSRFKGVTWHIKNKKWSSHICVNYDKLYLGEYTSEVVAAKVYDRYALEHHLEFASLNTYTEEEEKEWEKVKHLYENFKSHKKKSRFHGVYYKEGNKSVPYRAIIYIKDRQNIECGSFRTELEAALSYNLNVIKKGLDKPLNIFNNEENEIISNIYESVDSYVVLDRQNRALPTNIFKQNGKYRARVSRVHLGCFDSLEEALSARDKYMMNLEKVESA